MTQLEVLVSIAADLTAAIPTGDRYARLLESVRRVIPYDAAALLRVDGDALVVTAGKGLKPDVLGRRFALSEHPRLRVICNSAASVRFPPDSELPDPFDGFLATDAQALRHIHACLGCPLLVEDKLVGALTADALASDAFEALDQGFLDALGALAGAAVHTSRLVEALEQAAAHQGLVARDLLREIEQGQGELLGTSRGIQRVRHEIDLIAPSDFSVLVTGETGVGKELVVRGIHSASKRHDQPLAYVNCAALPESLAESELFGHVRGAFTGATADRHGKFEVANGGTLFLDEVGELPLSVQPKLLRAVQQGEVQRVGSDRLMRVDVRVLAATNRDLEAEVQQGRFRRDLYHRLNVYPLHVPPLRERSDDIGILAGHFCDAVRVRLGTGPIRLDVAALSALAAYSWPGNIRELENVISRAALKAAKQLNDGRVVVIEPKHLGREFEGTPLGEAPLMGAEAGRAVQQGLSLRQAVDEFRRHLVQHVLDQNGRSWAAAARALHVDRGNLYHLAKRLGVSTQG